MQAFSGYLPTHSHSPSNPINCTAAAVYLVGEQADTASIKSKAVEEGWLILFFFLLVRMISLIHIATIEEAV